jgi:outer membrane protein assembly factor BamB
MTLVAVVPIFTNVGAAIFPIIVAAIGSVVAVLLKPRELWRLCLQHPRTTFGTVAALILLPSLATWWFVHRAEAAQRPAPRIAAHYDWAKIAQNIISQQAVGQSPMALASPPAIASPLASTPPATLGSPASPPSGTPTPAAPTPAVAAPDFSRSNYFGGPLPRHLQVRWSFQPEDTMFLSTPLIVGKRIFAAGCQGDLGSFNGLLACLDADTGKPIWQVTEMGDDPLRPFFSSPAISADGKYLLIGQGLHEDRDCSLLCFDAATGRVAWTAKTPVHIESSPAVLGDLVVVGAGAIEGKDGKAIGDPGFVLAVRISDGKVLWRYAVNDPESSPAIDGNGVVYIGSGFNGNAVVALRSESDEQLHAHGLSRLVWRVDVAQPVTGAATLAGDLVVFGGGNADVVHSNRNAQGLVVAIDRKTGKVRWQRAFEDGVLGTIAFHGDKLICPVRTGEVVALAIGDGRVLWRRAVSGTAPVMAGCALTGSRVVAVSSDGYLGIIDAKDGGVAEKFYLNDQGKPGSGLSLSAPQVLGGRIFVGSETGGLRCLSGTGVAE